MKKSLLSAFGIAVALAFTGVGSAEASQYRQHHKQPPVTNAMHHKHHRHHHHHHHHHYHHTNQHRLHHNQPAG